MTAACRGALAVGVCPGTPVSMATASVGTVGVTSMVSSSTTFSAAASAISTKMMAPVIPRRERAEPNLANRPILRAQRPGNRSPNWRSVGLSGFLESIGLWHPGLRVNDRGGWRLGSAVWRL